MFLIGLATCVFLLLYWTVVPAQFRRPAFAVVSLATLVWHFPLSVAMGAVITLVVHSLLAGRTVRVGAAILVALVALAAHKYLSLDLSWLSWVPESLRGEVSGDDLRLVGLSYAVFRLIHVAAEVRRGGLPPGGAVQLLEYALFPPSFLSGPIERYEDFRNGIDTSSLDLDAGFWGARRVLSGLAKKLFLVQPLQAFADPAFADPAAVGPGALWVSLFAYSLVVYLDFSAYCDIALGVARLFGFRLSENFRWPYLATDIAEFWKTWHITLSSWLRDYVYLPASLRLARLEWLRSRPLLVGTAASLLTMLVCGLWHGNGASFLLWGLGHGVMLAGHQAYRQQVVGRLRARQRKALAANLAYRFACTVLTFATVSLLWPLFRLDPAGAVRYWVGLLGVSS